MTRCAVRSLLVACLLATVPAFGQNGRPFPSPAELAKLIELAKAKAAAPAPAPAEQVRFATERVVVFKDGYALIIKAGTATADAQGRVFTPDVSDSAVLGCLWAVGDEAKLAGMKSEWVDSRRVQKADAPALTIRDLLRANTGRKVTLTLLDEPGGAFGRPAGGARTVTGALTEVLETPAAPGELTLSDGRGGVLKATSSTTKSPFEDPSVAGTLSALSRDGELTVTRTSTPPGGDYVVLDGTETGRMVVPIGNVRSIGGEGLVTRAAKEEEVFTRAKRMSFDFGAENANKVVKMHTFYFTPGVRWIPTYRVSGELKDKADLALQGEIVNDLEDIDHAAVDLVVGVPNFRFKQIVSPLTLERAMRSTLVAVDNNRNDFSNGQYGMLQVTNQTIQSNFVQMPAVRELPAMQPPAGPGELAGAGEQDLFVYPLKDFSLAKGARASMPLWQNAVPLKHLYTFDLKTRRSRSTGGKLDLGDNPGGSTSSPLQLAMNRIWHQLELTNDSTTPWTTGAALMLKGNLPLGQDILTYTSPGSSTLLPVTVAIDLRATSDEEETERHNAALRVEGYDYAQVKKKGTITVASFRKEKSTLRITLGTGGKVDAASDGGKIKINDFRPDDWDESGYMRPNNHSDVVWEFTLEPGQSKTLTYSLSSYIR